MKTINQLIQGQASGLAYIVQRSRLIQQIDKLFKTYLPLSIGGHCHIVNIRDKTLVIHTDSAAWANRLRYMIPEFLAYWQADDQLKTITIENIEIKIRVNYDFTKKQTNQPLDSRRISKRSSILLRRLADSISHQELKSVLLTLANESNKK